MLNLDIPGFGRLQLRDLILDYNGTLALDGELVPGVAEIVGNLSRDMEIHVLTADTRGTCRERLADLPVRVNVLEERPEDSAKLAFVRGLGPDSCAAVGNGRNDRLMLRACALGVAVIGPEGADPGTVAAADIVTADIIKALELFLYPLRLKATLRT